jgi:hypothetical protein
MITTFTPNDVIRFVYGESLSSDERKEIEQAIIKDDELADTFYQTQNLKSLLDKAILEPSSRAVDNILHFSRCHLQDKL